MVTLHDADTNDEMTLSLTSTLTTRTPECECTLSRFFSFVSTVSHLTHTHRGSSRESCVCHPCHPHVFMKRATLFDIALPFYLTHLLSHSFHFFPHLKLVDNLLRTPFKESMDLSDEPYLRTERASLCKADQLPHAKEPQNQLLPYMNPATAPLLTPSVTTSGKVETFTSFRATIFERWCTSVIASCLQRWPLTSVFFLRSLVLSHQDRSGCCVVPHSGSTVSLSLSVSVCLCLFVLVCSAFFCLFDSGRRLSHNE